MLEHVPDDSLALAEIGRIIKAGGWLIMTPPGRDIQKHEKAPYQIDYRRYSPKQIKALLKGYGFDKLKITRKIFGVWKLIF